MGLGGREKRKAEARNCFQRLSAKTSLYFYDLISSFNFQKQSCFGWNYFTFAEKEPTPILRRDTFSRPQ